MNTEKKDPARATRLLTEMTVLKARAMLSMGWSVNGQWLVLKHDPAAQVMEVGVHDATGRLWGTSCPYTHQDNATKAREFALSASARWSLRSSGVCTDRLAPHWLIVEGRLLDRATPLESPRVCTPRRDGASVCVAQTGRGASDTCQAAPVPAWWLGNPPIGGV